MLMSLVNTNRVSELHAFDLHFRYHTPSGLLYKLASLMKKHQIGAALKSISLPVLQKMTSCVWSNRQYEEMTQ